MYTVIEISKKIGVSKATVYNDLKRFKVELKPYLSTLNRSKCLNEEGFIKLIELRDLKAPLESDLKVNFKKPVKKELNQCFAHLKAPLESDLKVTSKTSVEEELNQRIEEFKNRLEFVEKQLEISQKNLEREQQLHEHTQILLKQSQEQVLLLSDPENITGDKKEKNEKSLWERIFK